MRFCEIVNARETIETIRNISRKNLAVTPTITNGNLLAAQASNLQVTSNDPDGMPPLRVVLYLGSRYRGFRTCESLTNT